VHRSRVVTIPARSALGLALALVAAGVGACGTGPNPSPESAAASTVATSPEAASPAGSALPLPELPSGFPVLPGSLPSAVPGDDPGLIAAWTTGHDGLAAYDFYAAELPAAGYAIEGLYPGGEFAVIRFRVADGQTWQLVVHAPPSGRVELQVRLDRP